MDVTRQILAYNNTYGASDYTGPHTLSASKSLNYAEGASITKPAVEKLSVIPYTFKYQDAVGLFGVENKFIRVNVDVDRNFSKACYEEPWYECAEMGEQIELTPYYENAFIDYTKDTTTVNDYEPANIIEQGKVPLIYDGYISVDLKNLKVNNRYIDDWLDVRLYNKDREEVAEDKMYIRLKDYFYLGVHARNTKRLPYNIELTIGEELRSGLPSTECLDDWELAQPDSCVCVDEEGWQCGELTLYNETGTDYASATVDPAGDPSTVESYQPARLTLQGTECIIDTLSDALGFPRKGRVGQVPPPKTHMQTMRKDHLSDPCCTSCH